MKLVLLTFGDQLETHAQAAFCILSFLKADPALEAHVVTDRPAMYAIFGDRVQLRPVDDRVLREWQAPTDFFWRVKIRALQEVAAASPGEDLLYCDSDTLLVRGLDDIRARLAAGTPLMHRPEFRLAEDTAKTSRQMWRVLRDRTYEGERIDAASTMWNAGVIGVPGATARESLAHVLALCDAFCRTDARRRLLEQFAFSIGLDGSPPLQRADREILHYWGNKPAWRAAIADFWLASRLAGRTVDQDIAAFDVADHAGRPAVVKVTRLQRWLQQRAAGMRPRHLERFGE